MNEPNDDRRDLFTAMLTLDELATLGKRFVEREGRVDLNGYTVTVEAGDYRRGVGLALVLKVTKAVGT